MNKVLNVTNGSSAVDIMRKSGLEGDFLPWDDVLHVGPVPAKLSFEALSEIRAEYITTQGWASADIVDRLFRERSVLMSHIEKYEKVILWFEHDLYDQLQLLEILNYISTVSFDLSRVFMICTENYLGRQNIEEMLALKQYEESVNQVQVSLAVRVWKAFRANTPLPWYELLKQDTSALPFLYGAIERMLEEYPSAVNGLSRTQNDVLDIIFKGETHLGKIFGEQQKREERVFLGDVVFLDIVREMMDVNSPLIIPTLENRIELPFSVDTKVTMTQKGLNVLAGTEHWLETHTIDKWLGGVHLSKKNVWLWNSETQEIKRVER